MTLHNELVTGASSTVFAVSMMEAVAVLTGVHSLTASSKYLGIAGGWASRAKCIFLGHFLVTIYFNIFTIYIIYLYLIIIMFSDLYLYIICI